MSDFIKNEPKNGNNTQSKTALKHKITSSPMSMKDSMTPLMAGMVSMTGGTRDVSISIGSISPS